MFSRIFLFYILLMLLSYESFPQKNPENLVTDTLKNKKQSGLIKGLIDLVSKDTLPKENTDFQKSISEFTGYNGCIISDIYIKKVAVIEGNVEDTSAVASTWLGKAGDNLHVYTKERLIRKSLLFQEGDKVDPFTLADSERILRSYRYIEDVRIWVIPKDEEYVVDIIVVIKDAFSLGINASISSINKFDIRLYDVNFLGLGSELSIKTKYNSSWAPKIGYEGRYYVNNFGKSFISGEVGYFHTGTLEGITTTFERPLISTEFTYYGGISLSNLKRDRKEEINDSISVEIPYSLANADIWLGRLFNLGGKEKQNYLAVGVRFNRDNFVIRPVVGPDANIFFHDRQLFLASMEFFRHNFIKTRKLLGFGRVEDVRIGFTMRLTGGYEISEFTNQPYLRVDLGAANYFKRFGYLGFYIKSGAFKRNNAWEDGVVNFKGLFYSNLLNIRRHQFRQLISLEWNKAVDRSLREENYDLKNMIRGYKSKLPEGNETLSAKIESVFFAPFHFYGFKLAFFLHADAGLVKDNRGSYSKLFGSYGLGVRIKNEGLVFSTLVFRISFLPSTFEKQNIFNLDLSGEDPRLFRDFQISKPEVIPFR